MKWYIDTDHWRSDTEFGKYTVGDAGNDSAWVTFPKGEIVMVSPFHDGKKEAEKHYGSMRGDTQ